MEHAVSEETTDDGQKMQVRDGLNEAAVDDTIPKESTEAAHGGEEGEVADSSKEEVGINETGGDGIVEEDTVIEHTAPVREEEALTETAGDAIVETNVAELTVEVGGENVVTEAVGVVTVEESTYNVQEAQAGEHEVTEAASVLIIKESADDEHDVQVTEMEVDVSAAESFDGDREEEEGMKKTGADTTVKESSGVEDKAPIREEDAVTGTLDDHILEEHPDAECKVEDGGEMVTETAGDVDIEEFTYTEQKTQVMEQEVTTETTDVVIDKQNIGSEHNLPVMEEEAVTESAGAEFVVDTTTGEHSTELREGIKTEIVVEESTDGTLMPEVNEEQIHVDHVSIEETADDKHKPQVAEEDMINMSMSDSLVNDSTSGKCETWVVEEGSVFDEPMSDAFAKETTEGEEVAEGEAVLETRYNIVLDGSGDSESRLQIGEEAIETMSHVILKEKIDDESKDDIMEVEKEAMNETEKQVIESRTSETSITSLMDNDQHVHYHLPPLYKSNFSLSDLVWGKVKSHPWWPGQIFDPSDGTKLAMKYQKRDSFLIGYYGDKTFAWCDESQLKPFHSHFSQLEKQCSSDTFVKAVRDILAEVSRRVELGMACSCLPEEDYTSIKYQKVENAGIRGGDINSIIDRDMIANYFQPDRLLDYIEALAKCPNGRVDKLEFVMAQSQIKAFYHSKGYRELPAFTVAGGLVENVPESSPTNAKDSMRNIVENCSPVPSDRISAKGMLRNEEMSKREDGLRGDGNQKNSSRLANGGNRTSVAKVAERQISNSSGRKHTIVDSEPVDSGKCKKSMLDSFEDVDIKSPSPAITSFKIGEFIRRAASQLTGAPPLLKCQGETAQKFGPPAEERKNYTAHFDVLPDNAVDNQETDLSFTHDHYAPEEILSQLRLAAREPMEEHDFVSNIVSFLTGFRDFIVSSSSEEKEEHVEKRKRGRPRKVTPQEASSDVSHSEDEKHVEKKPKSVPNNAITQFAIPDIISEEEKPVVKRKRGRPRKNPLPASSDSEDKKSVEKRKRGRPRGRPKKVETQMVSPDYSSSENKKPVEKRKRGRPRKVTTEISSPSICKPGHIKGSCWSDIDLQKRREGNSHIQYQRKRRKSAGEQSLSLPSTSSSHVEQQLQLALINPNMRCNFPAERSIVTVEEKIVDERMPTALILSFNNASSLPSETDLIRIFSRYGPLKEAETDVIKKTNQAKVVFKRRVNAETAFSSAGKYSIFGPGLLSYQLKPWAPTAASDQNTAPAAMEQDNCDAAPSTVTTQDNFDVLLVGEENYDAAVVTAVQDECGAELGVESNMGPLEAVLASDISQVEAEGQASLSLDKQDPTQENQDGGPVAALLEEHETTPPSTQGDLDAAHCDAGPITGSNLNISERVDGEMVSAPLDIMEPSASDDKEQIVAPEDNQDSAQAPLVENDSAPFCTQDTRSVDSMDSAAPVSMTQDYLGAETVMTLTDKCDSELTSGTDPELSEQAADMTVSEAKGSGSASRDEHNQSLIPTSEQHQDAVEKAEDAIMEDTTQLVAENDKCIPQNDIDPALISIQQNADPFSSPPATAQGNGDVPPILEQDNHDAAACVPPILEQDNHDATACVTLENNYGEGPHITNSEHLEQEDVERLDTPQVEMEVSESLRQDSLDCSLNTASEQSQNVEGAVLPLDKHDPEPSSSENTVDGAPIILQQNGDGAVNHDTAPLGTLQDDKCGEPSVRAPEASTTEDNQGTASIVEPQDIGFAQNEEAQSSHDLAPSSSMKGNHDAAAVIVPEEQYDEGLAAGSNLSSEQTGDGTSHADYDRAAEHKEKATVPASLQVEVEGRFVPQDNHDFRHNVDSTSLLQENDYSAPSTMLDEQDATVTSYPQGNLGTAPINIAQDSTGAVSILTPQENEHEMHVSTPQDNQDANRKTQLLEDSASAPISRDGDDHNLMSVTTPSAHEDAAAIPTPQDSHHATSISVPEEKREFEAINMVNECCDIASTTTVGSNHDADDKCDVGYPADFHPTEQVEHVTAIDGIQIDALNSEPVFKEEQDQARGTTQQQNQQAEPVFSAANKHDSRDMSKEKNADDEAISVPRDNQDTPPSTTLQHRYDADSSGDCNLEISESEIASEAWQAGAVDSTLEASGQSETKMKV